MKKQFSVAKAALNKSASFMCMMKLLTVF